MKLKSITPHDQSVVGEVEVSTVQEVLDAVEKAQIAFETWQYLPISSRLEFIQKYREYIVKHKQELAKLITLEMGKPLAQSEEDIDWELGFIDYYIEKGAENLSSETVYKKEKDNFRVTYEPYGVCACIAPWNFPLSMFNSGVLPALIAGNTVVFKPSEYTTLSQKRMVELLQETGLPDGVLNIVYGDGSVGEMLVNSDIDLVWFTGSTKVGQEIYKKCGEKFIKALCELGGSSPGIVFSDCDVDDAVETIYYARFSNCGQVCSAIKRLFVEKSIYDSFVQKLTDRVKTMKIGNPMTQVDIGPMVSKKQLDLLLEQVENAVAHGAKVVIGGKKPVGDEYGKGNYFEPTTLTNIKENMRVMTEETFGPVLPIVPFTTEEEAIEMANNTQYGLSADIFTQDLDKAERVAKKIKSGAVGINTDSYYKPQCPIGGYKKSGIGREYGKIGMQEFTQIKLIAVHSDR